MTTPRPLVLPLLLLILLPFLSADLSAQDPAAGTPGLDLPVVVDTLPNGLRVIALRRPGAPTASFVLRVDVGSLDESLGGTGIAHFLEHLLFKGTTTVGTRSYPQERLLFGAIDAAHDSLILARAARLGAGEAERLQRRIEVLEDSARTHVVASEFTRTLTRNGARSLNATTSADATTFHVRLPANRAELWFRLEADRMSQPVFREFHSEREVVAEERRQRVDTSPAGRLLEEFYAAAYRVHPYGVPVIGHMSDIRAYTRRQVRAFHDRYYVPNNAVIAVVGDIDPHRIVGLARSYFGPIPRGPEPPPVLVEEPEQRGERRVEVRMEAEPELLVGWHVPSGLQEDAPALAVLSRVLGGGRTGRLYRRLVADEGLATSVSVFTGPGYVGPRMFNIGVQPVAGASIAELEAAIYDEVADLQRHPPTPLEMQRVRNQLEAEAIHRLRSNLGLALQLAESAEVHGGWGETFRRAQQLADVTAADVRRVAEQYLVPSNRTVAVLRPVRAVEEDSTATQGAVQ